LELQVRRDGPDDNDEDQDDAQDNPSSPGMLAR
jgi:hypothetical protein